MNTIKNRWLFLISVLFGIGAILCFAAYTHYKNLPLEGVSKLTQDIFVHKQVLQKELSQVKKQGFLTIVDLRPDGEAEDQPSSKIMADSSKENNLKFYYIPIAHGDISDQSVEQLTLALNDAPKPVLMYCRSGSRAARTWSLVEASKENGMDADSILRIVKDAGHSSENLTQRITQLISQRKSASIKNDG
jgi:uncharacterized protein (TIGR01244 family)